MRYLLSSFLLLAVIAGPNSAQDGDRAGQAKRGEAIEPVFKDEYRTSADGKALRGRWQALRITFGEGMVFPPAIAAEDIGKLKLEITEHEYLPSPGPVKWLEPGKKPVELVMPDMDGAWRIDPTTAPKSIVIYPTHDDLVKRIPLRGIYKLEGDTLTVCFGAFGKRPAGFDEKSAFMVAAYKRIQKDSKKPAK